MATLEEKWRDFRTRILAGVVTNHADDEGIKLMRDCFFSGAASTLSMEKEQVAEETMRFTAERFEAFKAALDAVSKEPQDN